jgi:hypothetical protein
MNKCIKLFVLGIVLNFFNFELCFSQETKFQFRGVPQDAKTTEAILKINPDLLISISDAKKLSNDLVATNVFLKKIRGQFFTTKNRVLDALVGLIKNDGNILEPSAGEGHIVKHIEENLKRGVFCVELDKDKVDYSEYENLSELYQQDFKLFIEYNIADTTLVSDLDKKLGYIDT